MQRDVKKEKNGKTEKRKNVIGCLQSMHEYTGANQVSTQHPHTCKHHVPDRPPLEILLVYSSPVSC